MSSVPEQFLHVVTDFVRQYIGLCELAWSSEAVAQFLEEAEIDIDLLVGGAVKGSGLGLGAAASGLREVAEEHQFGVAVRRACLRQKLLPGVLDVV